MGKDEKGRTHTISGTSLKPIALSVGLAFAGGYGGYVRRAQAASVCLY